MDKRKDGNEQEESRDIDRRTYLGTDNEGHLSGSNQRNFNEQRAQEAEKNDNSDLNKLDSREEAHGNI